MQYLVGIGNYNGLDDSIGLRIVEAIAEAGLDRGFQAIELGGNLLDLLHYLGEDTERVLIVDSARMGMAPGEYALFQPDQVATRKGSAGFSTHEGDLLKVLELGTALGKPLPPVTILGIEPAEIETGFGLSEALAGRMDEYVGAALGFFAG
ncbi:MAG: hydrogenase maturation protease [Coriobacteriia bacterium]|nr:hydrogenase maturation protease [Coriobacteriia bacterium]